LHSAVQNTLHTDVTNNKIRFIKKHHIQNSTIQTGRAIPSAILRDLSRPPGGITPDFYATPLTCIWQREVIRGCKPRPHY